MKKLEIIVNNSENQASKAFRLIESRSLWVGGGGGICKGVKIH